MRHLCPFDGIAQCLGGKVPLSVKSDVKLCGPKFRSNLMIKISSLGHFCTSWDSTKCKMCIDLKITMKIESARLILVNEIV